MSDLDRVKRGCTIIFATLVQTLNESDATFQERFLVKLGRAQMALREEPAEEVNHEIELLHWTEELLAAFAAEMGTGSNS